MSGIRQFFLWTILLAGGHGIPVQAAEWRYLVSSWASLPNMASWTLWVDSTNGRVWWDGPPTETSALRSMDSTIIRVVIPDGTDSIVWNIEGTTIGDRRHRDSLGSWFQVAFQKNAGLALDTPIGLDTPLVTRKVDVVGDSCSYVSGSLTLFREGTYKRFFDCGIGTAYFSYSKVGGLISFYDSFRLLTYNDKNIDSLWQSGLLNPTSVSGRAPKRQSRQAIRKFDWRDMGVFLGRNPKSQIKQL